MSNPYQAPQNSGIPASKFGLAGHVPVVAVLLIVQGALEILGGILVTAMGVFMTVIPLTVPPNAGQPPPPPGLFAMLATIYFVGGAIALSIGGVKVWAGSKNLSYRGRGLGIAAVCTGFGSLMTCYCGPTGVALAIYGLVVYLNDRTVQAFVLGEQGHTPQQIRDALS